MNENQRKWLMDLQSKGVKFEYRYAHSESWMPVLPCNFLDNIDRYRIPAQPIPERREEMIESPTGITKEYPEYKSAPKEDTKPEVPHKDLQIQWHEDYLHHLKMGEPMREWEYKNESGCWNDTMRPSWITRYEYRRKPRMKKVTYWHCAGKFLDSEGNEANTLIISRTTQDAQNNVQRIKGNYPDIKFSPIIETTVEIPED